jgi:hypothetical protein
MIRPLLLAVSLAAPLPALADPNAQLVNSVQARLDRLGLPDVDAGLLATHQIAALHLELQGSALSFGPEWIRTRQKVKTILRQPAPDRR